MVIKIFKLVALIRNDTYKKKSIYQFIRKKTVINLQNKRKSFNIQNSKNAIKTYLINRIINSEIYRRNWYSLKAFHGPFSNAQPQLMRRYKKESSLHDST